MRNILLLLWLFLFTACNTQNEPWTNSQLIEPSDLNIIISKQNKLPNIISVGPGKVIPNSIGVGECRYEKNLNILKNHLLSFSKDSEIILYCGCCPFKDCPNIRPAFSLLNSLGYKNHKLLLSYLLKN